MAESLEAVLGNCHRNSLLGEIICSRLRFLWFMFTERIKPDREEKSHNTGLLKAINASKEPHTIRKLFS